MDDEKDQLLQHAAIQRAGTKTSSALLLRMVQDQVIRPVAFCFFSFEASCTWAATSRKACDSEARRVLLCPALGLLSLV